MKKPVPTTGEGLTATAPLFEQNCVRCHGITGAADGSEAQSLPKSPAKFTDAEMLNCSGNGRNPMPSYAQCRIRSGGSW